MIRYMVFLYYYMCFRLRNSSCNYFENHSRYAGKRICSPIVSNRVIYELIENQIPFMAGRFGAVELSALKIFDFKIKSRYDKILEQLQNCAGFFPQTIDAANAFCELMLQCIPEVDILGVWGQPFEDYYIKQFGASQLKMTYLFDLEPWSFPEKPWSAALKGKKVLVIHPFAETIKKQYEKREKLFPGTEILPEFQLEVLKAVQTIAGETDARFKDWFEALQWMYESAMQIDFDVAIIGCGAYGFPLAAKLKKAGKQTIHLGGATQLLFGIKGKRWESDPAFTYVQQYFNEFWVYPDEAEKPERAQIVEGGCYW